MHHRIDAGCGGHCGRKAECQFGIEHRPVRQEPRRDHAFLLGRRCGHDRDRRHLRSGAGSRRRQHERQPLPFGQPDSVDAIERFVAFGEVCDEFCRIERRTAADRQDQIDILGTRPFRRRFDHLGGRVGDHIFEDGQRYAGFRQRVFGAARQPGIAHALVGDKHHMLGAVRRDDLGNLSRGARLE